MKKSTMIIALIALTGIVNAASIHYEAADSSPALRVYNGGTETLTINIYEAGAAATNTVVIGSTSTTIDGSGTTDTVAELAAAIVACTNSAGGTVLATDTDCSLGADSTDGELLSGTYTAAAGAWLEIPWDTSAALHYDVYIPDTAAGGIRTSVAKIGTVYGNPVGTGNVTLSIYKGGTLAYQQLLPEVYAYSNNTATVALPVKIDLPVGSESILVRATRATTATTGMIGITIE
jgi:hypothetical protein